MNVLGENEYATYVLEKQMEDVHNGKDEMQVMYAAPEQFVDEIGPVEMLEEDEEEDNSTPSRARLSNSGKILLGNSKTGHGYWSDADTKKLLQIYIKVVQQHPYCGGKPNKKMWAQIYTEFDRQHMFTEFQIRTKIGRLRVYGKSLMANDDESQIRWPLWNLVRTVLELDGVHATTSSMLDNWSEDQFLALIECYSKYCTYLTKEGLSIRREAWQCIATEMGKSVENVKEKFQKLRRKWLRWAERGRDQTDPWLHVLTAFNHVSGTEVTNKRRAGDEDDEIPKKQQRPARHKIKWTPESVTLLLENYLSRLGGLMESDETVPQSQIQRLVADEMNLPHGCLETKLTNLKNYFMKMGAYHTRRQTWGHYNAMKEIVTLEDTLWPQKDAAQGLASELQETLAEVVPDPVIEEEEPQEEEPPWFKQYRLEVEKRHTDRVNVLKRLATVMQALSKK